MYNIAKIELLSVAFQWNPYGVDLYAYFFYWDATSTRFCGGWFCFNLYYLNCMFPSHCRSCHGATPTQGTEIFKFWYWYSRHGTNLHIRNIVVKNCFHTAKIIVQINFSKKMSNVDGFFCEFELNISFPSTGRATTRPNKGCGNLQIIKFSNHQTLSAHICSASTLAANLFIITF